MKKYCFIGLLCAFVLSGCSNHVDTSTPVESVNKIEAPEIEKVWRGKWRRWISKGSGRDWKTGCEWKRKEKEEN